MSLRDKFKKKETDETKTEVKPVTKVEPKEPKIQQKQKQRCEWCGNEYVNLNSHLKKCSDNPDNIKIVEPKFDINDLVTKITEKMPKPQIHFDFTKIQDIISGVVNKTIKDTLDTKIRGLIEHMIVSGDTDKDAKIHFINLYNSVKSVRKSGKAKIALDYLKKYFNI